jgi:hypothetical protein
VSDIICWEAKTRGSTVAVVVEAEPAPPGMLFKSVHVRLDIGDNRRVTSALARQLAHTLLAAADVADEEQQQ